MRYGIDVPTTGSYAAVPLLADLAREAEGAGWDGFFVYDQVTSAEEVSLVDPWIALTAIALATSRLRFGPLVTPLPRRRPWKVARETATLDHLSGGRFILGVGLGIDREEFDDLGEEPSLAGRARMLDEALAVLVGLWSGEPFSYTGVHYRIRQAHFLPPSLQRPRIPIWTAGTWPSRAPFRRAARWDGVFPHYRDGPLIPPAELRALLAFVRAHREPDAPFEVVVRGQSSGTDHAAALLAPYAEAGMTWWLEGVAGRAPAALLARIRQGPPTG